MRIIIEILKTRLNIEMEEKMILLFVNIRKQHQLINKHREIELVHIL